ncbi:hypothetical protein Desca_1374 [Desulfotomaculum nigrificans CO-1-SRB]|uniref:Uncharacterized protein n=1 Tax=Desulfotomaculum nigrificans (strain DSM 14880 / VKM B-2319 / CO-1-SRB) TaxID=868595 RepID=F6B5B1_DESCC|nr:hypothetical protein [Desulfotomaculum nigrificans]AEF94232.1 hypothetical protein Desca_1374 [Desulfotomaculum nigrificans CO-1-SRB]
MDKDNRNNYQLEEEKHFPTGDSFVYEPTGSATCINVDCRGEFDFYEFNDEKHNSNGTGDNPLAE